MLFTIYLARNVINGKCYVGFDSAWPKRKTAHLCRFNNKNLYSYKSKFHRALRKYSPDKFEWEILYQSKDQFHTLNIMEPYFIKEYFSYENGYNATLGGEGAFGGKGSKGYEFPEDKLKWFSEFHKTRKRLGHSEETKIKIALNRRNIPAWNANTKGSYPYRNPKYSCIHCKKVLSNNVYKRHICKKKA